MPPVDLVIPLLPFLPLGVGILLALITSSAAATRSTAREGARMPPLARAGVGVLVGAAAGVVATVIATLLLPIFAPLSIEGEAGTRVPGDLRFPLVFPLAFFLHLLAFVALLRGLRVPFPELLAPLVHLPAFLIRLFIDSGALAPPGLFLCTLAWILPPAGFMVDLPVLVRGSIPEDAWMGAVAWGVQVGACLALAARPRSS